MENFTGHRFVVDLMANDKCATELKLNRLGNLLIRRVPDVTWAGPKLRVGLQLSNEQRNQFSYADAILLNQNSTLKKNNKNLI